MEAIFGIKDHLTVGQECARAFLVFTFGLMVLRLSGKRTFAQWSALDVIVSIVVGSCLSRAMTGNAPLLGTIAAVGILVVLHVATAYACAKFYGVAKILEGSPVILVRDGKLDEEARLRHMVSRCDLGEALRQHELKGVEDIDKVAQLQLEPNGKLTVLKL